MSDIADLQPSRELGTREIAKLKGMTQRGVQKWLATLERQYGPTVVGRRGKKMYTTVDTLRAIAPQVIAEGDLAHRVEELEHRADIHQRMITRMGTRIDNLEREIARLRDKIGT